MRMGRDPEDVVAFMLSDEMGRRLVEGKDPEAVSGRYRGHPRGAATVRHCRGCRAGRRLLARDRQKGVLSREVQEISVTNPAGSKPTFTLVSSCINDSAD